MAEPIQCQVAVIGSGPGGAVTAMTLAAKGFDVVMLEEGPYLKPDACPPFSIEEMRRKYRYGGLKPALGTPKGPLVGGCCVGGGSGENKGLVHSTAPPHPGSLVGRFLVRDPKRAGFTLPLRGMRISFECTVESGPSTCRFDQNENRRRTPRLENHRGAALVQILPNVWSEQRRPRHTSIHDRDFCSSSAGCGMPD